MVCRLGDRQQFRSRLVPFPAPLPVQEGLAAFIEISLFDQWHQATCIALVLALHS